MKHCIEFSPIDVWVLSDDENFKDRTLEFGICPVCNKPIAKLIQYDKIQKKYELIKKIGFSSQKFVKDLKPYIKYSQSKINKMKFMSSTYKWVYGETTAFKNKVKEYAKDFYGNKKLINEKKLG